MQTMIRGLQWGVFATVAASVALTAIGQVLATLGMVAAVLYGTAGLF